MSLCRDHERDPWNYGYTRRYRNVGDQDARDKMVADEAGTNATGMKAKQPRLDAAMARITKLSEQQPALMQKGDAVGAEALVFIGSEWPVDSFMGPEDKLSPRQRRGIPS